MCIGNEHISRCLEHRGMIESASKMLADAIDKLDSADMPCFVMDLKLRIHHSLSHLFRGNVGNFRHASKSQVVIKKQQYIS